MCPPGFDLTIMPPTIHVLSQGYTLPRPMMANSDIARIINSDEIQSVVRPARSGLVRKPLKKNPMKNLGALLKLNPYANVARRIAITSSVSHSQAIRGRRRVQHKLTVSCSKSCMRLEFVLGNYDTKLWACVCECLYVAIKHKPWVDEDGIPAERLP